EVLERPEAEQRRRGVVVVRVQPAGCSGHGRVETRDLPGDGAFAGELLDAGEVCRDGRDARRLDAGLVHAGGPVVTDLLLVRRALRVRLRGLLQRVAEHGLVPDPEVGRRSPEGLAGGDRVRRLPAGTDMRVPVDAWVDGG